MSIVTDIGLVDPIASGSVHDTWQGSVTVARSINELGEERVFVVSEDGRILLILTPTDAADLGEVLHEVSGMASSTRGAEYLAQVYRENFARYGVSKARAARETGISRHRLSNLLAGLRPMTMPEHKALSKVGREQDETA